MAGIVRLHAGEVPAGELLEVHDAVVVQVQFDERFLQLALGERVAEVFGEFAELFYVDGTVAIFIKFIERLFDIVVLFVLVNLGQFFHGLQEWPNCFVRIFREVGRVLDAELFIKMIHQVVVGAAQSGLVLFHDLSEEDMDNWDLCIVFDEFILLFEITLREMVQVC